MKNIFKIKNLKVVLPLLLMMVMLTSICCLTLFTASGQSSTPTKLTLKWSDAEGSNVFDYISECRITYTPEGSSETKSKIFKTKELEDGINVVTLDQIPQGASLQVKIVPVEGYLLSSLSCGTGIWDQFGQTVSWERFNFDSTIEMKTCVERTYKIKVVNYNAIDENFGYTYDSSSVNDAWWQSLIGGLETYTYTADSTFGIELPSVKAQGFDFVEWRVRTSLSEPFVDNDDTSVALSEDTITYKAFINNPYAQEKGEIYIYPRMEPVLQDFYRYDFVFVNNRDTGYRNVPLSLAIKGQALLNAEVTGLTWMGDDDQENGKYRQYAGYTVHICDNSCPTKDDEKHYKPTYINVSDEVRNVVYRLYDPIVYDLVYFMDENGTPLNGYQGKTTYTYTDRTVIPDPTRTGYTFCGWTVEVYKNGAWETHEVAPDFVLGGLTFEVNEETGILEDPNDIYASEKNLDGKYEIRLTARWTPNRYKIEYDWNVNGDVTLEAILAGTNALPKEFIFDDANADGEKALSIPNPVRDGYDFAGWILAPVEEDEKPNSNFTLDTAPKDPRDVLLVANWIPHKYLVALNPGDGVTDGYTPTIDEVKFDQALELTSPITCPQKLGFTFLGYFSAPQGGKQYINAEGESVCDRWDIYADADGATITLYAQWSRNSYTVAVDANELPEGTVIMIVTADGARYPYEGTPVSLLYETSFVVTITTPDGYKLVNWNGDAVAHSHSYTSAALIMGAQNMTVTATILPVANVPAITPNYLPEKATLDFASDGQYILSVIGLEDLVVTIQDGIIRVNGEKADAVVIPEEYFGKTVSVIYKGNETTSADSYPIEVSIASRPESPRPEVELDRIDDTDDRKLTVYMYDGLSHIYEFAISRTNDASGIKEWFSNGTGVYTFADLQPGTAYYIFIRTKATEDAPHGQIYVTRNPHYTPTKDYVDATIDELNSMVQGSQGDITSALIQGAIDQINQWASQQPLPDTFYQDVEDLMDKIRNEQLTFAQSQDAKIAALEAFLKECLDSGSFNEKYIQDLKDFCADAVTKITAGKSEEEIQRYFETAMVNMEMIPVTYRYDVNHVIQLISKLGLPQDSKLTLTRLNDIATLKQAVQEAIRSGGVVKGDVELLKTLEVVAAYRFRLDSSVINTNDKFTVRLTIPADLRGFTGLQIAYYAETANGITVEYVPVTVEGNEIVFETNRVGDFVILADSTVDLTAIIAVLGGILFFQIIALAAILITRQNAKKKIVSKHCSIAFPAFLAVHFLPVGGEMLALIMGAAVVLLQVILMILLLKSDMVHLGKKDKTPPTDDKAPDDATLSGENTEGESDLPAQEQEFSEESEEARIAAFLYGSDETETEPQDEESDPNADDPFAMYGEVTASEEEYDEADVQDEENEDVMGVFGEDFIEPAPDPYYSLPDEDADAPDTEEAYAEEEYVAEESDAGEYTEDAYAEEAYTEEYADEVSYEDAESFSLDSAFAEEEYAEEAYTEEAYTEDVEDTAEEAASEDYAEADAYVSDYVEEEPYDESSFEDAYVAEFYGEPEPAEEIPTGEIPAAEPLSEEEFYAEEPVFEAPVYEADEAEEDTDPMYRYDE